MTELVLLATCLTFASVGILSPFVWSLGYVWVDTLLPQRLSYSLLASTPIAFIMGAAAVASYVVQDRRAPPKLSTVHVLCMVMAFWITLTTTWAVLPDQAYLKWDISVKTVIFTVFLPFVFRTRVQIEAFILVFLFSAAGHLLPWGLKTAVSGGGYELSLGLMGVNATMLAESSVVSAFAPMCIPILLWFRIHSLIIPWPLVRTMIVAPIILLYLIASIGSFARTGLLALGVLAGSLLLRSKRKLLLIIVGAILSGVMFSVTSDRWTQRVSTISDYASESSAYTRILVWKWTLGFAVDHPLGGGFNSFMVNTIVNPPDAEGNITVQHGRAFHNIFFAALGEHGWPGLALYISIIGLSYMNMLRVSRATRGRIEFRWLGDLARAMQIGFTIILVAGVFVDISFNSLLWDMIAIMLCINCHARRVLAQDFSCPPALTAMPQRVSNLPTPGAIEQLR